MGTYINMVGNGKYSLEYIYDLLKKDLPGDLVHGIKRDGEGYSLVNLVFERYFLRNDSYGNISILLSQDKNIQYAHIVASGSGSGIFNISFGIDSDYLKDAIVILEECGFRKE